MAVESSIEVASKAMDHRSLSDFKLQPFLSRVIRHAVGTATIGVGMLESEARLGRGQLVYVMQFDDIGSLKMFAIIVAAY